MINIFAPRQSPLEALAPLEATQAQEQAPLGSPVISRGIRGHIAAACRGHGRP